MLEIREFRKNDINEIMKMEAQFLPKSREVITKAKALKLYKKNPLACLVAEKDGKIVGSIFGELEGKLCKIKFLIIDPDHLGESIVAKLIDKMLKLTGAKGLIKFLPK